jgi:hypothetical protein
LIAKIMRTFLYFVASSSSVMNYTSDCGENIPDDNVGEYQRL